VRQDRMSPAMSRQGRGARLPEPSAPSRVGQAIAPVLRFGRNRPGVVLAVAALLGSTGAIGWNALHQANRHPAPLFKPRPAVSAEAPRRTETAAVQPVAPVPVPVPVPRPEPTTVGSVPTPPPAQMLRASAPAGDPIGNLIRGGEPSARPAEMRPDARVMNVQKALTKLGYGPLKADGVLGTTTRQALERFERDKSLPVTGGLGTRTTRQLASASGTQIE